MSPKLARKSGTFAYICSQMYPFWGHLRTLARFWGHLRTLVRIREVCLYFNQNQYQTCKKLVETGKTVFIKSESRFSLSKLSVSPWLNRPGLGSETPTIRFAILQKSETFFFRFRPLNSNPFTKNTFRTHNRTQKIETVRQSIGRKDTTFRGENMSKNIM